jgi:hypothetical protein
VPINNKGQIGLNWLLGLSKAKEQVMPSLPIYPYNMPVKVDGAAGFKGLVNLKHMLYNTTTLITQPVCTGKGKCSRWLCKAKTQVIPKFNNKGYIKG